MLRPSGSFSMMRRSPPQALRFGPSSPAQRVVSRAFTTRSPAETGAAHPSPHHHLHHAAPASPEAVASPSPHQRRTHAVGAMADSQPPPIAAGAADPRPALSIPDIDFEDPDIAAHMPLWREDGRVWDNPWPTWKGKTVLDIAKFLLRGFKNKLPDQATLERIYPMHLPDVTALHSPHAHQMQVTWVGHSTFLVQVDGVNILTDPVWSNVASPVTFGPKRYRPPGLPIEKLPRIDLVLLSHNHYDHLDRGAVQHIGNSAKWYVPLGMREWFYGENVTNCVELGWWEHAVHARPDAAVFLLPAQHWSKRTMWDERRALWGSFAVVTPRHRFYFAGDTGYCSAFSEIGKRFGPFDLSLLPIGAYEPRAFMGPAHVDPGGAVHIHQYLRSRKSIGMHFGTFRMTEESASEPPRLLLAELEARGVSPRDFFVLNHGETVRLRKEADAVHVID